MTQLVNDFIKELNFRTRSKRCEIIKEWLKAEESFMNQNSVDIPDFMKPVQDRFEYRFRQGIHNAIKDGNRFWELYDRAKLQFAQ